MSFWSKIGSALSPSNRVAGIVDAAVDRLRDKYDFKVHIDINFEVLDKKPEDRIKLDDEHEAGQ